MIIRNLSIYVDVVTQLKMCVHIMLNGLFCPPPPPRPSLTGMG
jgi:hypothetical protein